MSNVIKTYLFEDNQKLEICQGDITQETLDAIVNAANAHLRHGGGVAKAILDAGGAVVQSESDLWIKKYGPIMHESPAYTTPGKLACKYIIHAVGPIWGSGDEENKLDQTISGALNLAVSLQLKSIAFPAISTGIYGFPVDKAAAVFFHSFRKFFNSDPPHPLNLIRMVLFDYHSVNIFVKQFDIFYNIQEFSS
ncbi:MAG: macro domain-containing protein [Anaerolineaceae bacterium]